MSRVTNGHASSRLIRAAATLMLVARALPVGAASSGLECGGELLPRGAFQAEVRAQCGGPFWVNEWVEAHVLGPDGPVELAETLRVSEWYFNRGPNRLMRRVRFHNGRLVDVDILGYGVSGAPGTRDCEPRELSHGLTMGEIVARCGLPAFRETAYGRRAVRLGGLSEHHVLVRIETWGYDFGPNKFTRYVTFENGKLTDVALGERGSLH